MIPGLSIFIGGFTTKRHSRQAKFQQRRIACLLTAPPVCLAHGRSRLNMYDRNVRSMQNTQDFTEIGPRDSQPILWEGAGEAGAGVRGASKRKWVF